MQITVLVVQSHVESLDQVTSLATLPDLFPNLIQLVASKNLLDHIPPLSRLASLADVQLWGNPIHEADDTGYRVQIAAQFQDRVAHVVVDGQRLVPLPPMPGKRKQGSAATGVKARVVKLEGDGDGGDLGSPRSPTSPPKAGKRSPLASQVDLANVKEEDEGEEVDDRVSSRSDWRSAAMRPPTRTNSDPTMRRTAHAPTSAHVGGGTTAADAALAEERIRRKIDELKKQGGAQNWMRQMVSEAAGRQRMPHAAVAASQSASASADVGDGTAAGRVDTGAHTPTSGVAGSTSAGSPIHRPRSTGSLRQQAPATLTPAVPTTSNTPSPRHGHGRKPSTTASYASPPQPASTDTLPHNPSSSHPSPALSPPHSPTMGHADSALATTPPRPPQLHAHIAHHQKPRRSLAKRTALTYSPLLLSDSLVELPLADTIAARITCTPATCWGQLTCRATRAAGIGYVTVKYDGERADEVAKRWAHVLAREVKANQARGHVVDVCPRGECVVCGVTGWVPDHVGKRRNPANGDVEGEGEVVVGEVDGRTGRYLDVRVREKSGVGAKGQVECAKCGTVVAVYFGTSLES
ncbi:hypothetical protein BCR44DRAFT_1447467 [Catenaria anguillulae PL171]|uniref:Uncharacterized protein n=1 Tax=Catenaria anguillulae PL171 TaxID=765915 RepID=A0A1Y2H5S7_9FUNG|nr:hypothetical protein BCR44DRAFT_1447467 [Catenaria anguillulae PL171]